MAIVLLQDSHFRAKIFAQNKKGNELDGILERAAMPMAIAQCTRYYVIPDYGWLKSRLDYSM